MSSELHNIKSKMIIVICVKTEAIQVITTKSSGLDFGDDLKIFNSNDNQYENL
jgi:hypothetical protein